MTAVVSAGGRPPGLQLEPFVGTLDGRTLHLAEEADLARAQDPGQVRLLCSSCPAVVARNMPVRGIFNHVFECRVCGALSVVGPHTLWAEAP